MSMNPPWRPKLGCLLICHLGGRQLSANWCISWSLALMALFKDIRHDLWERVFCSPMTLTTMWHMLQWQSLSQFAQFFIHSWSAEHGDDSVWHQDDLSTQRSWWRDLYGSATWICCFGFWDYGLQALEKFIWSETGQLVMESISDPLPP